MSQMILGTSSGMGLILWIVVLFALMYFLMVRPQKKQQDKHKQMLSRLKPNDRILTVGGITGYVRQVTDDYIYVEIADGMVIELSKPYIATVLHDDEEDLPEEDVEEIETVEEIEAVKEAEKVEAEEVDEASAEEKK